MSKADNEAFDDANSIILFDQETMSGITPGVRTRIFQRVRLQALDSGAGNDGQPEAGVAWARLLWHLANEDTVDLESSDEPGTNAIEGAVCTVHLRQDEGDSWSTEPLVTLANVSADRLLDTLKAALVDDGWRLQTCGSCRWWQPGLGRQVDGLPVGHCRLGRDRSVVAKTPEALSIQSMLTLDCAKWAVADGGEWPLLEGDVVESPGNIPPALPKHAESVARGSLLSRISARFRARTDRAAQSKTESAAWQEMLVERSGVGAGTEPCFACQGRIANLGSLTVETLEGDKQTYSVWRCRTCFCTFLNSWIDRWERLDNLETDERVYRLAPVDACECLAVIDGVVGGDHPAGREQRGEQRRWFELQIEGLDPVSHQIKHGR